MTPIEVTLYDDAPVYGGAERYLELLALGFDRKEVLPHVVLARDAALDPLAGRLAAKGIDVKRLPRVTTLSSVAAFVRVFAHLVRTRSKILHFNLVDPRACNGAIVAATLATRATVLATNQLPQSPFDSKPVPRRHRKAMAAIRRHIVVSAANRADLAAQNIDPRRISVIHNATEDPGPVTAERRAKARATLGAGPETPLIGFSGRLVAQKAPGAFIEMAAKIAATRGDARFIVMGEGPERSELEVSAHALGMSDRIRFLGHREDAIELYTGLDLLVFTSRYEGLPFAAIEAMALGVPIVAIAIPGMDEAVTDRVTGRLVGGGGGPRELAAAIIELLVREEVRTAMGAAARSRILSQFSVEEMVRKTVDVYRELLRSPTNAHP